jgi:hypothetical protein
MSFSVLEIEFRAPTPSSAVQERVSSRTMWHLSFFKELNGWLGGRRTTSNAQGADS